MARKRVVEAPSLHSWEDVNDTLRQIAEAQIALGEIQSDMQKQILGAQKVAEEQSKPLNDNVAKLEREIKSFVTDHRDEMGKTKSMVLTFGEVGFRLSTSVSLPRAKEKLEEIIRRLKSRQMTDCIVVEEKVSKEALKKYGEDTVNAVGATWKQSDVFGYERLARYCDEQISKAILGQTLTSDSGGGSYAQSKTHNDVRHDLTVADCKALASTLRRDLIRPLCIFNFGEDKRIPYIRFDCEESEDLTQTATILGTLIEKVGLRIPTSFVYKKFSIPEPEEGDEIAKPTYGGGMGGVLPFKSDALSRNRQRATRTPRSTSN